MNIGEISARTGMPTKTIRYYEDIGLIKPNRSENGYRAFDGDDLHRLTFLARSRALGFSIDDCRTLLDLWQDQSRASGDVKQIVASQIAKIDRKVEDLLAIRTTLTELSKSCAGNDRPACPIIEGLSRKIDISKSD